MGMRFGLLNVDPWERLMPRITLYRRSMGDIGKGCPLRVEKNLMAEIWALMCLCDMVGARYVAKRTSVCSDIGKVGR